jgi:hypothetical protein
MTYVHAKVLSGNEHDETCQVWAGTSYTDLAFYGVVIPCTMSNGLPFLSLVVVRVYE